MRITRYKALLLIVAAIACGCCSKLTAQQCSKKAIGVSLVSDQKTGTILIDVKLNGEPVIMILDTGASHSLVDAATFGLSPLQLQAARMGTRGLGLDAEVLWRTADFSIGQEAWKQQPIEIADLRLLSKIYGRKIGGIIGQDVLRTFDSVQINYKGHCVMLEH